MERDEYRKLELEVGRAVLGARFDAIFGQNDPIGPASRSALQRRVTIPKEPESLKARDKLVNRIWTDGPKNQLISQVAIAGEFLYKYLQQNNLLNHICITYIYGGGHGGNVSTIDYVGTIPKLPEFMDNGFCTVLNLAPQNNPTEAVRGFLSSYFLMVSDWIDSAVLEQRWINLTYAFMRRLNDQQSNLETLRHDFEEFLTWYQTVRACLIELSDENSLILPETTELSQERFEADLALIIRNSHRDQSMLDRFWRGGYLIEFARSIKYQQVQNHKELDSLLLGLQIRLPN